MKPSEGFLHQRKAPSATVLVSESTGDTIEDDRQSREEVVWGKTPGGEGMAVLFFSLTIFPHLSLGYSLPRADDTRRPNYSVPSWIPQESS